MAKINLTQFTDAGGCGCKISPGVLAEIIQTTKFKPDEKKLLVANYHNDDAAVFKISKSKALVFTDDFFTPIIDDPFSYGKIAACNALSDVYAMGASPFIALSILGWPVEKIPVQYAREVLEGAKSICDSVGVFLSGGHSINNPQPIFGLSVVGQIRPQYLKLNSTAKSADLVYLTKRLGTGVYSTALKLNKISGSDKKEMIKIMCSLNVLGIKIAKLGYVNAMTDVSGFGLFGHLIEICQASNLSADILFKNVQLLENARKYIENGIASAGGRRNWESYKSLIGKTDDFVRTILTDPQTNGGLLITIDQNHQNDFESFLNRNNLSDFSKPIAVLKTAGNGSELIALQ
jgi:selenide,water dikinase